MFFGKRFSGHRGGPFSGLNILVLSIIKNHDKGITGYDIIHEINEKFKTMWKASPGTIYPLLGRLEERGFVESEEIIDENNRQKKIYKITSIGEEKLEEILKDNFGPSINTLGDYIRTIIQTWLPEEQGIKTVMSCFPFHCGSHKREINEEDCSLENIHRIERILKDLKFSKKRLTHRLENIEMEIKYYQKILEKVNIERDRSAKTIPIVDGDEFEKDF
ncbi:MAG: PadR family transcriptional regulator [Promethearchaeota archaeon]